MSDTLKAEFSSTRVFSRGDRLFPAINDLLIFLSALSHASSLMVDGQTHKTARPVARIGTRWPDLGFVLPMRGPLENALKGAVPISIEIGIVTSESELAKDLPNAKLSTEGLNTRLCSHRVSHLYDVF